MGGLKGFIDGGIAWEMGNIRGRVFWFQGQFA